MFFSSGHPIKSYVGLKSKIKFQYLGFEFTVMLQNKMRLIHPFSAVKSLNYAGESLGIIFRPQPAKIKAIKNRLKAVIRKILDQPRHQIYIIFQIINSILLGWGSYYYFNQGCVYGKRFFDVDVS